MAVGNVNRAKSRSTRSIFAQVLLYYLQLQMFIMDGFNINYLCGQIYNYKNKLRYNFIERNYFTQATTVIDFYVTWKWR